jgi:hypothetical protein
MPCLKTKGNDVLLGLGWNRFRGVVEYAVSQPSLEQIFLKFASDQRPEEEGGGGDGNSSSGGGNAARPP